MQFSILDTCVQCSVHIVQWYGPVEYILFINAVQSTAIFRNLIRCDVCVTMPGKQIMFDILDNINFDGIRNVYSVVVLDKIE